MVFGVGRTHTHNGGGVGCCAYAYTTMMAEDNTHLFRLHQLHLLANEVVHRFSQDTVHVFLRQPLQLHADRQAPLSFCNTKEQGIRR